jgi:hypothetical protein
MYAEGLCCIAVVVLCVCIALQIVCVALRKGCGCCALAQWYVLRLLLLLLLLQEDEVAKVGLSRYSKVSRSAFGLNGKKRIAVLRAGGAILGECSAALNTAAVVAIAVQTCTLCMQTLRAVLMW